MAEPKAPSEIRPAIQKVITDPSAELNNLALQYMSKQGSENYQTKEQVSAKPEMIDLGKAVAFFAKPNRHLPFEQMLRKINSLREKGIAVFFTDEGRHIAGHLDTVEKYNLLNQEFEHTSLGVPPESKPLLAYFDFGKHIFTQGNLGTISAARDFFGESTQKGMVSQIAENGSEDATPGYKGTLLKKTPLTDLSLESFQGKIPAQALEPINPESIKTTHYDKVYVVRIDRNDSTVELERATSEGQILLNKESLDFFNFFHDQIQNSNVLRGTQGYDSNYIYITDIFAIRSVEKALSETIRAFNLSVKTVGQLVEDVDVIQINGIVEYSSKPVPEQDLVRGEKAVKTAQQQTTKEHSFEIGGHIFFRHSKATEKIGIPLPSNT